MPLLWRYLLGHYLKVFTLCVASFIAILLTLRLSEIAYFATLGPQAVHIAWFILQQIPFVLPIAFPVSALIASVILMQTLSRSKELTALRSAGLALRDIFAPILIAAVLLSLFNFVIISEVSTASQRSSNQLKNELRSVNPLLLLNNRLLMRMKGLYFDTLGNSRVGEYAEDIVFISPSGDNDRMSLMTAKRIDVTPSIFTTKNMTLVSGLKTKEADGDLIIENMEDSISTIQDFSGLIDKRIWSISNDHLSFKHLLARRDETKKNLKLLMGNKNDPHDIKQTQNELNRTTTEIIRRFSVAAAVFSFTLLGLSFGISISRNRSGIGLLIIAVLSATYLITFFVAKSFDQAVIAATLLYTLPHLVIWCASFWNLRRVARGIE